MEHGLGVIPNQTEIERAYSILLHDSPCAPRTEDLAIFSQWSRFDPRLAEIWVRYLAQKWGTTNPISLRDAIESQPWPGAIAPLLEFVKKLFPTDKSQLPRVFGHWSKIITDGRRLENVYLVDRRNEILKNVHTCARLGKPRVDTLVK